MHVGGLISNSNNLLSFSSASASSASFLNPSSDSSNDLASCRIVAILSYAASSFPSHTWSVPARIPSQSAFETNSSCIKSRSIMLFLAATGISQARVLPNLAFNQFVLTGFVHTQSQFFV